MSMQGYGEESCRCCSACRQQSKETLPRRSVGGVVLGCVVAGGFLWAMFASWRSEIDLQARTRAVSFTSVREMAIVLPGCMGGLPCPVLGGSALSESPEFVLRLKPGVRVEIEAIGRRITIKAVAPGVGDVQPTGVQGIAGALDRRTPAFDDVLKETAYRPVASDISFGETLVLPDVGKLVGKNDFLSMLLPARVRIEVGVPTRDRTDSTSPMLIDGKAQFSARTKVWLLPADPAFPVQEQALYAGDFAVLDTSAEDAAVQPLAGLIQIDEGGVINVRVRGVTLNIVYEPFGGGVSGSSALLSENLIGVVLAHPLVKLLLGALAALSALWGIPKLFGKGSG